MATSLADINAEIKKNEEQLAQLKKQAEDFRSQERAGVIDDVRKKIAEYGLTAADLKLSSRAPKAPSIKSSAVAKYRGPAGESWSGGRGRKPRWVTEALAAGKSLSDFEIN
jgi:DNA-binding protein H-NS